MAKKAKFKVSVYEAYDKYDKRWVWRWSAYAKYGWFLRHWNYVDSGEADNKSKAEVDATDAINRRARSDSTEYTFNFEGA